MLIEKGKGFCTAANGGFTTLNPIGAHHMGIAEEAVLQRPGYLAESFCGQRFLRQLRAIDQVKA